MSLEVMSSKLNRPAQSSPLVQKTAIHCESIAACQSAIDGGTEAFHATELNATNEIKSMSMRGPGSGDTCHLTDFNETWPD